MFAPSILFLLLIYAINIPFANTENNTEDTYKIVYGCEGSIVNIECNRGELISIVEAYYGRKSQLICGYSKYFKNLCSTHEQPINVLKQRCHSEMICSIPVNNYIFGDPCPAVSKYIQIKYKCVQGLLWYTMFYP